MCLWYHSLLTLAAGGLTDTMYTPVARFSRAAAAVAEQGAGADAATVARRARRTKADVAQGRVILLKSGDWDPGAACCGGKQAVEPVVAYITGAACVGVGCFTLSRKQRHLSAQYATEEFSEMKLPLKKFKNDVFWWLLISLLTHGPIQMAFPVLASPVWN